MKAYKLLNNYNGRYFSYNAFPRELKKYLQKQKMESIEAWKVIEYFPDKWAKAKRNAKEKHLFVFNPETFVFNPKVGLSEGLELWEVEVPELIPVPYDWHRNEFFGYIIPNSFLCTTLKMVRKVM